MALYSLSFVFHASAMEFKSSSAVHLRSKRRTRIDIVEQRLSHVFKPFVIFARDLNIARDASSPARADEALI
jgi:hypothetical protein